MSKNNYSQNGSIFRVHKTENYTLMHNHHLRNKELPLKAKGLLSVIFSLPPDWNFSINGLATLSLDGRDSVLSIIKILQKKGYLYLETVRNDKGQFNTIYNVFEEPQYNFTKSENPIRNNRFGPTESENIEQINTSKTNIKKQITYKSNKKQKQAFGEFNNVFLTDEHLTKLKEIYKNENKLNEAIEILSSYKESKGKKYKNDYAVLGRHNWVFKKVFSKSVNNVPELQNENKSNVQNYENLSRW